MDDKIILNVEISLSENEKIQSLARRNNTTPERLLVQAALAKVRPIPGETERIFEEIAILGNHLRAFGKREGVEVDGLLAAVGDMLDRLSLILVKRKDKWAEEE